MGVALERGDRFAEKFSERRGISRARRAADYSARKLVAVFFEVTAGNKRAHTVTEQKAVKQGISAFYLIKKEPYILNHISPAVFFGYTLDGKLEEVLPRAEKKDITDEAEEAAALLATPMPKTEFIALIQTKLDTSRNHARDILDCAKVLELVRESYENDPQNPKRNLKLISPN